MKRRTRAEWKAYDAERAKRDGESRCAACRQVTSPIATINGKGPFCNFECYLDFEERQQIDAERGTR